MINIEEYRNNLDLGKYGNEVLDNAGYYDSYYDIDDIILEVARNNVDVYDDDLFDFIVKNPDRVEEAIEEYGWDGVGGTLIGAAQLGETSENVDVITDNLDNIITNYALKKLQDNGIEEVDETFLTNLESRRFNDCSKFEDIATFVSDYVKEHDLLPSLEEAEIEDARVDEENKDCQAAEREEER